MKLKHNKLRNPAILFELLVRQITTDTLNNKESKAVGILKKHFNNSQLAKEYKIYKTLTEAKNLSEAKANVLINVAIDSCKKLNKHTLKREKYSLISDIKENYSIEEFFKSKIENYKTLASVYMLFEMADSSEVNADLETKCRFTIMESISSSFSKQEKDPLIEEYESYDKGTKALVYKLMVQKFNEKYSNLDINQKNILKEYITNISTSEKLREYVNLEYAKLKKEVHNIIPKFNDEVRKIKLNEVLKYIEPIAENKQVCEKDIENILHYYELLKEFKQLKIS